EEKTREAEFLKSKATRSKEGKRRSNRKPIGYYRVKHQKSSKFNTPKEDKNTRDQEKKHIIRRSSQTKK
ncbi:21029_t:CDS:1, partial [Racocetra persica]